MKRKKRKGQQKPINMRARLRARQQALTRNMTSHEIAFLRRLAIANLAPFDFQVLVGYYIVDFIFPTKMLVIEIDGSHHNTDKGKEWDTTRDAFLVKCGFKVVRIPNSHLNVWDLSEITERPTFDLSHYKCSILWATDNKVRAFREERPVVARRDIERDESPIDIAREIGARLREEQKAAAQAVRVERQTRPRLVPRLSEGQ